MTVRQPSAPTPFDHRMAVFDSDEDFLAAALPFLGEGLAAPGEPPPVAIADPRNLDLLRDALGGDAKDITCIPHTDWYTGSAANAVARAAAYLAAHAAPGGGIHLLMEPVWSGRAGRSARETTEWIRYEALANPLFAPMATTALCAYDTRTAGPAVVAAARRTHPDTEVYEDPVRLTAELDAVPLPLPPVGVERLAQPHAGAVQSWAQTRGLPAADAELFATAVAETAAALAPLDGAALLWGEAPACVCELRSARRIDDPLAGFVPPPPTGQDPGPGLWYARQVCAYVDIRDDTEGATVRLQYA
ncbi:MULTISPECIES: MEDS domain-containing protein [Streptomyces]|uniref:MEDS domain-containing protein n=1 Tax=Streptomyces koelreuteriae TaxID=2838015 RepID=A0ABX8FQE0_9ACTN|nr:MULTISPECIES: MEDS domain-containing protein [Streptomyces]QWB23351.1 MEDS domain-containing protein [Streptomyces koelreuteriae]UUA06304.1 MEDS domain-containing protein [Streptomyces koelreuteriae]UUA13932.1 MEDS domain-containing protein [Streptomyces sp. CRCS-T-1]